MVPQNRTGPGHQHLLDLSFRVIEPAAPGNSTLFSTAHADGRVQLPAIHAAGELAAVDLTPSLPASPLTVERHYTEDKANGDLIVSYTVKNRQDRNVEVGSLGISMVFDQLFSGRSLAQVAADCSFTDPYIGGGAGYVQVVSTTGTGPVLLVLPELGGGFEAWRLLEEDLTARGVTFEGWYELLLHSKAYANEGWLQPWNPPSSRVLAPGEVHTVALRFALAPSLRAVGATLLSRHRPVASAVPGYVLSAAMQNAELQLLLPDTARVTAISSEPAGALEFAEVRSEPAATPSSSIAYRVRPSRSAAGRVRATINYTSTLEPAAVTEQSVHYFVLPELEAHTLHYAKHLAEEAYTTDPDPFGRTPAFFNMDQRPAGGGWSRGGVVDGRIMQDQKAWVAGLSDECGAGPSVGMAVSVQHYPQRDYVKKLEQYVDETLWGGLQYNTTYGVKASMFYSGKRGFHYTTDMWGTWPYGRSLTDWRSYNYPHVTAVYHALYRLARNYDGLVTAHPWGWYLEQALNTTLLGMKIRGRYNNEGLMVGSIWVVLLRDLHDEATLTTSPVWVAKGARQLEAFMADRAAAWSKLPFPFGSEMPWDSTGQEEVYSWAKYFNYTAMANLTLNAVLAYTPKMAHWGYQGNARRYFDFIVYGGENDGTERLLHHYGAPLNALVVLDAYRANPDDLYLLEVGLGGVMGSLTNINHSTGFASMGWHGGEERLYPDPTSCDFGIGYFGAVMNMGSYLVQQPKSGSWKCFLCDAETASSPSYSVTVTPRDAFHTRLFFAAIGLDIQAEAGSFSNATLSLVSKTVTLRFQTTAAGPRVLPNAVRVRLTATAALSGRREAIGFVAHAGSSGNELPIVRGGYEMSIKSDVAAVMTITWTTSASARKKTDDDLRPHFGLVHRASDK